MSGAFLHVVADRNRAQPDDAGERRANFRLRELAPRRAASAPPRPSGCFPPRRLPAPEMKLLLRESTARSYFAFASVRLAFACCTSASRIAGSSLTSIAPLATRWPSWNPIALMRPATSGRSVTDSSERRLPTAVIDCGIGAVATVMASTITAGAAPPALSESGPPRAGAGDLPAAAPAPVRCWPNQYPPPAATATPSTAITTTIDLFILDEDDPIRPGRLDEGRFALLRTSRQTARVMALRRMS